MGQKSKISLATNIRIWIFRLIFLAGFLVLAFPIVSQVMYFQASHANINAFKEAVTLLTCTPYMGSLSTVMGDLSLTTRENQLGSLSFWMFKAMRILLLKFLKLRKPKACRLMSLISLLVASNLALERDS